MNQQPITIDLDHCEWLKVESIEDKDSDRLTSVIDIALEHARYEFNKRSPTWMSQSFWKNYIKYCSVAIKLVDQESGDSMVIIYDSATNKALAKIEIEWTDPTTQTATVWAPITK